MGVSSQIEIPFSKKKTVILIVTAIGLSVFGILALVFQPELEGSFLRVPIVMNIFAVLCILLGALIGILAVKRIRDGGPALIIDEKGIINNTSQPLSLRITWNMISDIVGRQAGKEKFILLMLHKPEELINSEVKAARRSILLLNLKKYGSPVYINVLTLDYSMDDLRKMLDTLWQDWKVRNV
jgi:hypothetical protein